MTNADSNINHDLKEAILSCAREEMRKFIGAMLMPGITNQTNDTSPSYRSRPPTNNEGRQTPLLTQRSSARSCRRKTAGSPLLSARSLRRKTTGSPLLSTAKAYQPRRSKNYRKINTSNSTLCGITLTSHVVKRVIPRHLCPLRPQNGSKRAPCWSKKAVNRFVMLNLPEPVVAAKNI